MKKLISTLIVLSIMSISVFAGDPPANDPNCTYGHINSPIYQCEPPPSSRMVETGDDSTADNSVFSYLKTVLTSIF